MKALFEKDLRLILVRKSSIYIYLIIGAAFTWQFSGSFSGAYLTMLGTTLALSTLSYDDSDNCMEFIFTLPCTRKQYVVEKYLFVYAFSLVAGLIGLVIIVIASFIKGEQINVTMLLEIVSSEIPVFVIVGGIMIPLQLKFGPEKTRIVLVVIFGAVFVVGFMLAKVPGIEVILSNVGNALNTIGSLGIFIILVVILIILSVISSLISIRIIDNKAL